MKTTFIGVFLLSCIHIFSQNDVSTNYDPDDKIGDKKFTFRSDAHQVKIPYYANIRSIDDENEAITRAVIVIQGAKRQPYNYHKNMMIAAKMTSNQLDTLLVIAPQLITASEIDTYKLDSEHLYWSSGGWKIGNLSKDEEANPRNVRVSSFTVMDSLLMRFSKNFPNLKTVVFSGHSAGGQFVNRYAAASPIPTKIERMGIEVRFIVNNPSSYLYLDNKRYNTSTKRFEVPETECVSYNDYKYGLEDLPKYLKHTGVEKMRTQYGKRDIIYLIGEYDNEVNGKMLDTSCKGSLQGSNRLERGLLYYKYLQFYYGNDITNKHKIGVVPNVGHSSKGMFISELGRYYAFKN